VSFWFATPLFGCHSQIAERILPVHPILQEELLKGVELFDLKGRIAVITGGTTGLGREIALGYAEAGADVVVSSRRQQQVDSVAAEIEAFGRRTLRVTSDVLNRA
jgi:hypothetical protein